MSEYGKEKAGQRASYSDGTTLDDAALKQTRAERVRRMTPVDFILEQHFDKDKTLLLDFLKKNRGNKEIENIVMEIHSRAYYAHAFNHPIATILDCIEKKEPLDEIFIAARVAKNNFRFLSLQEFELSYSVSTSLVTAYHAGYQSGLKAARTFTSEDTHKAKEKRISNADDHARKMFEIFQNSEQIVNSRSTRAIAKFLNESQIATARGGKWHPQTIQDLFERWRKMNLSVPKKEL